MPSYRPHASTRWLSAASASAVRWVNGSPDGVGTSRWVPTPTSASRAVPQTSGRMTMPAPPPKGVSSTVRCRSVVQSRRSWTRRSRSPDARALPTSESSRGLRYSGKIETTSMRTSVVGPVVARSDRLLGDDEVLGVRGEQAAGWVEHHAAAGDVDDRHDHPDEGHQRAGAVELPQDEHVVRRQVLEADDLTEQRAVHVLRAEPGQLVGVPGVVLVRRV